MVKSALCLNKIWSSSTIVIVVATLTTAPIIVIIVIITETDFISTAIVIQCCHFAAAVIAQTMLTKNDLLPLEFCMSTQNSHCSPCDLPQEPF